MAGDSVNSTEAVAPVSEQNSPKVDCKNAVPPSVERKNQTEADPCDPKSSSTKDTSGQKKNGLPANTAKSPDKDKPGADKPVSKNK
jgi:hypothetical protein